MGDCDRATSSYSSQCDTDLDLGRNLLRRRSIQKLSDERRQCKETFATLRRLVNARNGLTQLELLQQIIDYISDLQTELNRYDLGITENKENLQPSRDLNISSQNSAISKDSKESILKSQIINT